MSNTKTGGHAFPTSQIADSDGMTLRDYFAAKAMQGMMVDGIHENDFAWASAQAYKVADAMLKARGV
jgi:hypothetical protein